MKDTFYQDHWLTIEAERLERYEQMFQWRPEQDALLAPLGLEKGMTVVDYGCGPGFLSMEIARRIGGEGQVFGLDINSDFVTRANARAGENGLREQLEFRQIEGDQLPLDENSVDRALCKNVLEYVPDAVLTLQEIRRCLKPGGLVQIIDSDWGFVVVEPWGKKRVDDFFQGAAAAFREPYIGRKLPALLKDAGYGDIDVDVSAFVDTRGRAMSVLTNMCSYIAAFDSIAADTVGSMMDELTRAIESGHYLFVLPQFMVTARRPL